MSSSSCCPWFRHKRAFNHGLLGAPADGRLTFGDLCDRYLAQEVQVPSRRARATQEIVFQIDQLRRSHVLAAGGKTLRLEDKKIDEVTKADVEEIRDARRQRPSRTDKFGEVQTNRLLARLRRIFNWAIEYGYVNATPFKRHGVTVIKLSTETHRDRRLIGDEEERLMRHAGPHLQALIVAALQTGCRLGELLSLRWRDIRWREGVIALLSRQTKTAKARTLPMTGRLRAVLEMRRIAPDGREHDPETFVFGNEVGEPVKSTKTAWRLTCQRSGITDLHFHDLRREFACRLLEAPGVDPHQVRDWLGHSNISVTSRYLSTSGVGLRGTARNFEKSQNRVTPDLEIATELPQGPDQDGVGETPEKGEKPVREKNLRAGRDGRI